MRRGPLLCLILTAGCTAVDTNDDLDEPLEESAAELNKPVWTPEAGPFTEAELAVLCHDPEFQLGTPPRTGAATSSSASSRPNS